MSIQGIYRYPCSHLGFVGNLVEWSTLFCSWWLVLFGSAYSRYSSVLSYLLEPYIIQTRIQLEGLIWTSIQLMRVRAAPRLVAATRVACVAQVFQDLAFLQHVDDKRSADYGHTRSAVARGPWGSGDSLSLLTTWPSGRGLFIRSRALSIFGWLVGHKPLPDQHMSTSLQ